MKSKKKTEATPIIEMPLEVLKLGEIQLHSSKQSLPELGGLIIELLKEPDVKNYLGILEFKKKVNGGIHYD